MFDLKKLMKNLAIFCASGALAMFTLLTAMLLYGDSVVKIQAVFYTGLYFGVPGLFSALCYFAVTEVRP